MGSRAQAIFDELTPSEDGNDNWRQLTLQELEYYLVQAVLEERQRCSDIAGKWAKDEAQHGEVRLVSAYIRSEINGR